jgi:hypothetical protein
MQRPLPSAAPDLRFPDSEGQRWSLDANAARSARGVIPDDRFGWEPNAGANVFSPVFASRWQPYALALALPAFWGGVIWWFFFA